MSTNATTQTYNASAGVQRNDIDPSPVIIHLFAELLMETQLQVLSQLFALYMSSVRCLHVPEDFLFHAANAMLQLQTLECLV